MPIDSSIAMGVQPMKIDSPMNALAQILQVQNAQQANQLGSMTMQHKQQEYDDTNKLNSFYTGALGEDGKIDRAALRCIKTSLRAGWVPKSPACKKASWTPTKRKAMWTRKSSSWPAIAMAPTAKRSPRCAMIHN